MTPQVNTNLFNFVGLLSICFAESGSLLFEVAEAALLFEVAVAGYYLKLRLQSTLQEKDLLNPGEFAHIEADKFQGQSS